MADNPIIKGFKTSSGEVGKVDYDTGLVNTPAPLTSEDIFNLLTEDGKSQAIVKENGQLFINVDYLQGIINTNEQIQIGSLTPNKLESTFGNNIYSTYDDFSQVTNSTLGLAEDNTNIFIGTELIPPVGCGKYLALNAKQNIHLHDAKEKDNYGKLVLQGSTYYTVSFYAMADNNGAAIKFNLYEHNNYSSIENSDVLSKNFTLSSQWTRYTFSQISLNTAFASVGIENPNESGFVYITGIQIEEAFSNGQAPGPFSKGGDRIILADNITQGTLDGSAVNISNIDGSNINRGTIKSVNFFEEEGNPFSNTGTKFDIDTGEFKSRNFYIDKDGNAAFNNLVTIQNVPMKVGDYYFVPHDNGDGGFSIVFGE